MSIEIRLLDRNAVSITLWNAMCAEVKRKDILEHFNVIPEDYATTATIKITVNDIEVDFTTTFAKYVEQFDAAFKSAVEKKALEIVMGDEQLSGVAVAIYNAEYEIQQRIHKLTHSK